MHIVILIDEYCNSDWCILQFWLMHIAILIDAYCYLIDAYCYADSLDPCSKAIISNAFLIRKDDWCNYNKVTRHYCRKISDLSRFPLFNQHCINNSLTIKTKNKKGFRRKIAHKDFIFLLNWNLRTNEHLWGVYYAIYITYYTRVPSKSLFQVWLDLMCKE